MTTDKTLIPLIFKTVFENTPCLNTFLTQTIARKLKIPKSERKKLSDKLRYLVKKLEKHGFLSTRRISKRLYYIFPAPQFSQNSKADAPANLHIDLIASTHARNPPETPLNPENSDEKADLKHAYLLVNLPRYPKAHPDWFNTAKKYWKKAHLTKDDIEEITEMFEYWKDDVKSKVLLFLSPNNTIEVKQYSTRFTDETKSRAILAKAYQSLNKAFSEYDKAIFLTITLPRVFPLKVSLYILSFLLHRIKAYVRKHTEETTPHFKVNEPQNDFYPHAHVLLFGVDWLMPKHELTKYLDKHLENFLSNFGNHYKMTINKRATDNEVKALNKLGKRFLKKYKRYKAKHPNYEGVINWVTKVKMEDGELIFQNPPPDAVKFFKKGENKQTHQKISVVQYLVKYIAKNVAQAAREAENKLDTASDGKIAFYWLMRIPFYTMSPKLRPKKERPPPQGWIFLCSCYAYNLEEAMEYAEWAAQRV